MKLSQYLKHYKTPITDFAKDVGVSPKTIYHILEGSDIRLSIAIKIERHTMEQVTCQDLYSEYEEHIGKNKKKDKGKTK
jgi:predicted transcriptional regulator